MVGGGGRKEGGDFNAMVLGGISSTDGSSSPPFSAMDYSPRAADVSAQWLWRANKGISVAGERETLALLFRFHRFLSVSRTRNKTF